ncbi:hypothetical protein NIES4071_63030 [Calothrix sp. NIES-4071]|nr:hypothetical protein NIES4071_63030 [Calothrix sp. NIES-4071]BAZ60606.1 hypothetical protein NIES4105_62980 [Calothrix sp. NIES-4105]
MSRLCYISGRAARADYFYDCIGSSIGGCRPIILSSARILITLSLFNAKVATVTLATGVKAIIYNASPDQIKCWLQEYILGLNRGTSIPNSKSIAVVLSDFLRLQ